MNNSLIEKLKKRESQEKNIKKQTQFQHHREEEARNQILEKLKEMDIEKLYVYGMRREPKPLRVENIRCNYIHIISFHNHNLPDRGIYIRVFEKETLKIEVKSNHCFITNGFKVDEVFDINQMNEVCDLVLNIVVECVHKESYRQIELEK